MTEDGWTSRDDDNRAPWVHPDGRKQQERPEGLKPLGVIALADGIKNNGALVKFDISANTLNAEGCEAIANALKDNNTVTELNIAKNDMTWNTSKEAWGEMSAVGAIADAIPTMGALTSLNVSSNHIGLGGDMSGVKALAAAIPECR